jgi:uncharacterized protein YwgA
LIKELDVVLLVAFFGINDSSVKGRTRVQKDICILKYQDGIPFNFDFESHYYGPYSSELTNTVDMMVASGILEENTIVLPIGVRRYDYSLTKEGKKLFATIENTLERKDPDFLAKLKTKIGNLQGKTISEVITIAKECSGIQSSL